MILVCGEALLDMLPDPAQSPGGRPARFVALPGGSPANTAVALARLGTSSALAARISGGPLGTLLREHLLANGVDMSFAVDATELASLAFPSIGPDGSASYSFYVAGTADWQWTSSELPSDLPEMVTALHTGSVAAAMAPGWEVIAAWFRSHRGKRLLSFDPNVRPGLVGTPEAALVKVEEFAACVDVMKASADDLAWLCPGRSIDEVAVSWRQIGAALVVVTLGASGCVAYGAGAAVRRPAPEVAVVDTVGAGDAFTAGLLHHLEREGLTTAVRDRALDDEALGEALEYASAVAALACTKPGADPPRADEVERLRAGRSVAVDRRDHAGAATGAARREEHGCDSG